MSADHRVGLPPSSSPLCPGRDRSAAHAPALDGHPEVTSGGFALVERRELHEAGGTLEVYLHPSGLRHVHVRTQCTERTFAIAFRTPPDSDDGRSHVLEHLVLCGSERFPVHQPFMAMNQRSLASFMNALTFDEHTVYPFSTPCERDFDHLLAVYLDAAFFPLLRENDFREEGWRLVPGEGPAPRLEGVVFNEMKAALTDPAAHAQRAVMGALFPGTAYAFESGGDPLALPGLTRDSLAAYHRSAYHPARSVALTHGPVDVGPVHVALDGVAQRWAGVEAGPGAAPMVSTLTAPQCLQAPRPGGAMHAVTWAWALGPAGNGDEAMIGQFMGLALTDGDASPVGQALSSQPFGRPGEASGTLVGDEVSLWIAMEDLDGWQEDDADALVHGVLVRIAEEGLPAEYLEAVLRGFEMDLRQAGDEPLGVERALAMAPFALRGEDPTALWDPARLADLADRLTCPAFVAGWVRERLLDNPRRVTVVHTPDPGWLDRRQAQEQALTERLAQRHRVEPFEPREAAGAGVLPCLALGDVDRRPPPLAVHAITAASATTGTWLHVPEANPGMANVALELELSSLPAATLPWARLALALVGQMGVGERGWADTAGWLNQRCQDFSTGTRVFWSHGAGGYAVRAHVSAQSLARCADGLALATDHVLRATRFDDVARLRFLVRATLGEARDDFSRGAVSWASLEALAFHPVAAWNRADQGRPYVAFLREVLALLGHQPSRVVEALDAAWAMVLRAPRLAISQGGAQAWRQGQALAQAGADAPAFDVLDHALPAAAFAGAAAAVALVGSTPLSSCHQAWVAPGADDGDAPAMEVLARAIEHGFLQRAVCEQGSAYACNAWYQGGAFAMGSYDDPRLRGTFQDFDRAAEWAQDRRWSAQALLEAKLSVLRHLAAPRDASQRADATVAALMAGRTHAQRAAYRAGILDATGEDLRRVARRWLTATPHRAALVPRDRAGEAHAVGLATLKAWPAAGAG